MDVQSIRQAYKDFFVERGHAIIPRALLVPQDDPSTLFTGSGMQPLIPYLLGEHHPSGTRLVDSQTCIRVQDIEEVGDNRHTTFFEMLGNWSLGDYFKKEQIQWFWEFLVDKVGLDPKRIYVTCFSGNETMGIPKDTDSASLWKSVFAEKGIEAKEIELTTEDYAAAHGDQGGRIFFYRDKNWWCRAGDAEHMPIGEPGGPDSELFYLFPYITHDKKFGEHCHVNCDCGRYIELANSVFMEYVKTSDGFKKLAKSNVDYGGGLERIAAAAIDDPDIFKVSVLWPIIASLEKISGKTYETHTKSMRVLADHLRCALFLALDGVVPSNKEQGYVMRRLMRRAIRFAFDLEIDQNLIDQILPVLFQIYSVDFPEMQDKEGYIHDILSKEEKLFRQTLRKGIHELTKIASATQELSGKMIFTLHDTFGFPYELSIEEADRHAIPVSKNWRKAFDMCMSEQKTRSQTAGKGVFKGGLADHSEIVTKYHTATHLMYKALRTVLGEHVIQKGSNITTERLRFDFTHHEKVTPEHIAQVENIVNEQIQKDWPMSWREENTKEAITSGVMGAFGDRYGETVKVYTVGDPDGDNYSREICGGPHVEHTGLLAEGSKKFVIVKEEASSAGVRRIKAQLL
ncbi:MAG: alanine--tRNA ligase [Candidatus Saccharimonadales bacterium]